MRLCARREAIDEAALPPPAATSGAGPLELTAALEDIAIDERELAGLAPGDIIATEVAADGEVIVRIGGIPKFAARLGTSNGHRALTITRRLDEPREA
jgi:flagellar motor switch protein FliM